MPKGWEALVAFVLVRDRYRCHLCAQDGADTADHVIPISKRGTDDPTNLRAAHKLCNRQRGNHALPKVAPRKGRFG